MVGDEVFCIRVSESCGAALFFGIEGGIIDDTINETWPFTVNVGFDKRSNIKYPREDVKKTRDEAIDRLIEKLNTFKTS